MIAKPSTARPVLVMCGSNMEGAVGRRLTVACKNSQDGAPPACQCESRNRGQRQDDRGSGRLCFSQRAPLPIFISPCQFPRHSEPPSPRLFCFFSFKINMCPPPAPPFCRWQAASGLLIQLSPDSLLPIFQYFVEISSRTVQFFLLFDGFFGKQVLL